MEHTRETAANRKMGSFGGYACRWCGRFDLDGKTWLSSAVFDEFIPLMDHLIRHHLEMNRLWDQAKESNPFEENLRLKVEPIGAKPIPDAKRFLPSIADWLEPAIQSIPGIQSITDSSLLVADKLASQIKELAEEFREQRNYLIENEGCLRDAAMDPKWPRRSGAQARFLADSMAGARWGYKPTSSREFIRNQRPKMRGEKTERKEGRWWEKNDSESGE